MSRIYPIIISVIACLNIVFGEPYFRNDYKYDERFDAFYKVHRRIQNWTDAVNICDAEGAHLIVPGSQEELEAVVKMVGKPFNSHIWIGLHDLYSNGFFITLEGSSDYFTNWDDNEPNNKDNKQFCVIAYLQNNKYYDYHCYDKWRFVCKRENQGIKNNTVCETYDERYFYSIETDHCYKVHNAPLTWFDAFRTCVAEQAHLAIINSETEAKLLIEAVLKFQINRKSENFDKDNVFLGFNDLISPGSFFTNDGKPIWETGYEVWASGQPDNNLGNEHCGAMFKDGKLNDVNCNNRALFICEKALTGISETVSTTTPKIKI